MNQMAKDLPKDANRSMKAALLNTTHRALCLEEDSRRLAEGVKDVSKIWTAPTPKVKLLLPSSLLCFCASSWAGDGYVVKSPPPSPPLSLFSLSYVHRNPLLQF
jgi:hypothetical protein